MRGNEAYKRLWTKKARANYEIRFVKEGFFAPAYIWLLRNDKINFFP